MIGRDGGGEEGIVKAGTLVFGKTIEGSWMREREGPLGGGSGGRQEPLSLGGLWVRAKGSLDLVRESWRDLWHLLRQPGHGPNNGCHGAGELSRGRGRVGPCSSLS